MTTTASILASDPISHVIPHRVFPVHIAGHEFWVTNHMIMVAVSAFLVFIVFTWLGAATRKNPVPTGLRNFFESIVSFLRTEVFRPALGVHTDRFAPFLWTVFFFILFCNLLGMIPMGEILTLSSKGTLQHLWGTATGGIWITAALAIVAFLTIHISGIFQQIRIQMDPSLDPHHHHHHGVAGGEALPPGNALMELDTHAHATHAAHGKSIVLAIPVGIWMYGWNFAPHPETGNKIADLGLFFILLILEFIGALVKPFSLCVRLFANMLAGHLLLGALVALIPVAGVALAMTIGVAIPVIVGCTVLSLLELLVAFLQAYIFTFLTTLFIGAAVAPEH